MEQEPSCGKPTLALGESKPTKEKGVNDGFIDADQLNPVKTMHRSVKIRNDLLYKSLIRSFKKWLTLELNKVTGFNKLHPKEKKRS